MLGRQKLATNPFEATHGWRPRWVFLAGTTCLAGDRPFIVAVGGARELLPAEALVSGASYLVEVSMIEPGGNSTIVGEHGFVW